jgi:hypothetical protein
MAGIADLVDQLKSAEDLYSADVFSPTTYGRQATLILWSIWTIGLATGIATLNKSLPAVAGQDIQLDESLLIAALGLAVVMVASSFTLCGLNDIARSRASREKAHCIIFALYMDVRSKLYDGLGARLSTIDSVRIESEAGHAVDRLAKDELDKAKTALAILKSQLSARAEVREHGGINIHVLSNNDFKRLAAAQKVVAEAETKYWQTSEPKSPIAEMQNRNKSSEIKDKEYFELAMTACKIPRRASIIFRLRVATDFVLPIVGGLAAIYVVAKHFGQ